MCTQLSSLWFLFSVLSHIEVTTFPIVYLYRLCEESVLDDLAKLKSRVASLKTKMESETEMKQQTQSFLEVNITV